MPHRARQRPRQGVAERGGVVAPLNRSGRSARLPGARGGLFRAVPTTVVVFDFIEEPEGLPSVCVFL